MEAVPAVVPLQAALRTAAVPEVVVAPVNFVPVLVAARQEVVQAAADRKAIAVGMDVAIHAVTEVTVDGIAIASMRRGRKHLRRSLSD